MTRRWLVASALALIACDATSEASPTGDGGQSGSGGSEAQSGRGGAGGGSGGRGGAGGSSSVPMCGAEALLSVEQDGELLTTEGAGASGSWTTLGGREVFRIRLLTSHDPIPQAIDDEFAIVTLLDLVPSALLDQRGEELIVDQTITTGGTARSFADDASLEVESGATHDGAIRRVLVEQSGFGTDPRAASITVTGTLRVQKIDRRVVGKLELAIAGRIPLAFGGESTRIEGCYDFEADVPSACTPGETCGNDCIAAEEWPCWACGTLYMTHDCECRPDQAPLEECSSSTDPAPLGALCGEQWWCDRPCADGLICAPDPSYGRAGGDEDAGVGDACEHYTTCQEP